MSMTVSQWKHCGKPVHKVQCVLGETYYVAINGSIIMGKFIKVSPKGYNFLHEKSNMCIMKGHWYIPVKWQKECRGPLKKFRVPTFYDVDNVENSK